MLRFFDKATSWQHHLRRLCVLSIIFLASALTLIADTPTLLRTVPTGGCFCHCSEWHRRGGCVKLCDSKKYASRWWAIKCAKPHMQTPKNDSHVGPKFPHPGRSEHAQLHH